MLHDGRGRLIENREAVWLVCVEETAPASSIKFGLSDDSQAELSLEAIDETDYRCLCDMMFSKSQ